MHHLCMFGEGRNSNNLDTRHTWKTLSKSWRRSRWYSITPPPRLRIGDLKREIPVTKILWPLHMPDLRDHLPTSHTGTIFQIWNSQSNLKHCSLICLRRIVFNIFPMHFYIKLWMRILGFQCWSLDDGLNKNFHFLWMIAK